MHKTAVRSIPWLLMMLAVLTGGSSAVAQPIASSPARQRDLLAVASGDHFWIARIAREPDSIVTSIVYREKWAMTDWTTMQPIPDRVISMATSNDELLVVLSDGLWEIADGDDIRTGPPGEMWDAMLAIAAVDDAVWAVVRSTGASTQGSDATEPATQPAVLTASPLVPAGRLMICQYADGQWTHCVALPESVGDDPAQMALTVVDGLPVLAWRTADGRLSVSALSTDDRWSRPIVVSSSAQEMDFKLLTISSRAVLWISAPQPTTRPATQASGANISAAGPDSAGQILIGPDFVRRISLALPTSAAAGAGAQTLVAAFGNLRWVAYAGDRQVEQDYSLDQFPKSFPPAKMSVVQSPQPPVIPLTPWIVGDVGIVALAVAAGVRQRNAPKIPEQPEIKPRLAPMSVRFVAGLVDLAPILAVIAILHPTSNTNPLANIDYRSFSQLAQLSVTTYVLHTLIAEVICGQSIGKMVFGLRVMAIDGKPPRRWQLVARNLLRVFDVTLMGIPLLIIFITPLHLRVGDLVGGTVVAGDGEDDEGDEG